MHENKKRVYVFHALVDTALTIDEASALMDKLKSQNWEILKVEYHATRELDNS